MSPIDCRFAIFAIVGTSHDIHRLDSRKPPKEANKQPTFDIRHSEIENRKMVGAVRFELTTSCTPSKRAYQATLRPDRKQSVFRPVGYDVTGRGY